MLKGCDISTFQEVGVDISSYDFVIVRSSYGVGEQDEKMTAHANNVLKAGKLLGFYHYAYPDTGNTGKAEAQSMLSYVRPYLGKCILALDWEGKATSYPAAWILEFMNTIKMETGLTPFFYSFAAELSSPKYEPVAELYPLWVANWDVDKPSTGVWDKWVIWQYQGDPFDLDYFDGTAQDWNSWADAIGGQWIAKNDWLTQPERENNCLMLWNYFRPLGWSLEAVSAMAGNMEYESNINPGIWGNLEPWGDASEKGYGLVQWTPYTRITNWLQSKGYSLTDGNAQCEKIQEELEHPEIENTWHPTTEYTMTFREFSVSTGTPDYLADVFLKCYERPANPDQPERGTAALRWYKFLEGSPIFVPRLTSDGMRNNPYWYADNPFYVAGFGLPNCTCYAWGRWWEITGARPDKLPLGDASDWMETAKANGLKYGSTPRLGAIACYDYAGGGHVSVVEKMNADGSITTSNSAWGGVYFFLNDVSGPEFFPSWAPSDCVFEGFIYLDETPVVPPEPPPYTEGGNMSLLFYLRVF